MSITRKVIFPMLGTLIFAAGTAHAINITINDSVSGSGSWYGSTANTSYAREDNEVEPGCIQGQQWDLEGFYLNGTVLSMVGGYDFMNGQYGDGRIYTSGDIFFDINNNVSFGTDNYSTTSTNGYKDVTNRWGYDYAVDLNFSTSSYTVYAINSATLVTAYYRQNDESNPLEYSKSSTTGTVAYTGYFTYLPGLASYEGLTGLTHNVVSLDLGDFLAPGTEFTSHFTMGCGNDNLMGHGSTPVPEPGTLMLLGVGLVGLAGIRRRKRA